MTKIYDLHSHSDQSDGILSPEALVSRAKLHAVDVLALTDHDTLAGVARAQSQAKKENIDVIAGIEFSCQWNGRGIHIVGLNVDVGSPVLVKAVAQQIESRNTRAEMIARKLESLGIDKSLTGAKSLAGPNAVIGRPHFAQFLVNQGYVSNINQAFKRYLGSGKPGDVKQVWPEVGMAVDWINSANGKAVLAHPDKYSLTRTKLCALTEEFAQSGGKAIEVISGKQTKNITENLTCIAEKFNLAGSCGSDFHSPKCAWQELGRFGKMPDRLQPVWELWDGRN